MAEKFKYATAKKFTEGHTEVLGDQSESATPTPAAEDPKMLARYAQQREMNRRKESMPFNGIKHQVILIVMLKITHSRLG